MGLEVLSTVEDLGGGKIVRHAAAIPAGSSKKVSTVFGTHSAITQTPKSGGEKITC